MLRRLPRVHTPFGQSALFALLRRRAASRAGQNGNDLEAFHVASDSAGQQFTFRTACNSLNARALERLEVVVPRMA